MTERTAYESRSATELNNYGITQAFKRSRVQEEPTITTFLTVTPPERDSSSSTDTIVTVIDNQNDSRTQYTARKIDRLNDKEARFKSHKEFLTRCLAANVIPNGLKIELEASIGNHNEEFLTKWHEKLNKFSRELTQDVIEFCGKTITETSTEIVDAKQELSSLATQEQRKELTSTLEKNQETRSQQLKRNKDKKFYSLKYNTRHKPNRQKYPASDEDNGDNQRISNNNGLLRQDNTFRKRRSRTNLLNGPHSRRNSSTNLASNGQHNQQKPRTNNETDTLRQRVHLLESKTQQQNKPVSNVNSSTIPSNNWNNQKNTQSAQSNEGAPIPIQDMLEYITNTMQTLNNFKTQLTQLQDTRQTPSGTS